MNDRMASNDISPIVWCPQCTGTGATAGDAACSLCRGSGVALVDARNAFLLHHGLSSGVFTELATARLARRIVRAGLVLFGFIGAVFGGLEIAELIRLNLPVTDVFELRNPTIAVFWLSWLTNAILLSLVQRENHNERLLPHGPLAAPRVNDPAAVFSGQGVKRVDLLSLMTPTARLVLERAFRQAHRFGQAHVGPLHLLAGMLMDREVSALLVRLEVSRSRLMEIVNRQLTRAARTPVDGRAVREVLASAYQEARHKRLPRIDVPELLVATTQVGSDAQTVLDEVGVEQAVVRHAAAWANVERELRARWRGYRRQARFKPKGVMDRAMTAQATPMLDHFSTDLTALARIGALPMTVDREQELNAMYQLLEGGRYHVLLVGEPGVGKTSILHALAERMVTEDVPAPLQDKRLVSLSIPRLVAGATGMGGVEERMTHILTDIAKAGNIVLVLENVEGLVGVSSSGGANLDLSEIFATALGQGAFLAIGTTTPQAYRGSIEGSSGLFRAFRRVDVREVDAEAALAIAMAKTPFIEFKHKVFFSYRALEKAVALSTRFIHERSQPEKSLTLLEETAANVHRRRREHALVTAEDVAAIISEKTQVAVTEVSASESEKLLHMEERLHERIVGQAEAVSAVASALRRARAELRDMKRPVANLLFLGPTGVGKTELAKALAQVYFGREEAMVRLDMSEYQEPSSLSRLLGAAPGYAGSAGGGYLTEAVRQNPFALVLLDEIEKAHPDILNVFLQVMDDGRLTDSQGRTIDFTNTIIIATSNAGTDIVQARLKEGANITMIKQELMSGALARYFRPEFLNRFDNIVVFQPLTQPEIEQIAGMLLAKVAVQLQTRGILLRATPEAVRELAQIGFDPLFGARPLRRTIQERVDDALAKFLLSGKLGRRDVAILEPGGVIRVEKAEQL
jgi:ATP-dependent Clp protease ATP-binding subunit ClpC